MTTPVFDSAVFDSAISGGEDDGLFDNLVFDLEIFSSKTYVFFDSDIFDKKIFDSPDETSFLFDEAIFSASTFDVANRGLIVFDNAIFDTDVFDNGTPTDVSGTQVKYFKNGEWKVGILRCWDGVKWTRPVLKYFKQDEITLFDPSVLDPQIFDTVPRFKNSHWATV